MTSLSNISNPAKRTYTDNDEYMVGIKPATARYAEIGRYYLKADILGVVYTSPQ